MKKNLFSWLSIIAVLILVYFTFFAGKLSGMPVTINQFYEHLNAGKIKKATLTPNMLIYSTEEGAIYNTSVMMFYTNTVTDKLLEKKVETKIITSTEGGRFARFMMGLLGWLPAILFFAIWIYFMKKSSGGSGGSPTKLFGFGKSKAKVIMPSDIKTRFADVQGIDEAKEELVEIVDFLKTPAKYRRIGGKIPKGCLLFGSPGCGKTLLAKAIAGEASVPFFSISGSDFVEMFVGVGASRVRELFADARSKSPCIIFIDEIDAVGRHRGSGVGGGNDEREQTLNQLLVEMDGFDDKTNVVVIAATNRPDVLDKALMRPGRFDRQITIQKPDLKGRAKVLAVHSKDVKLAPDVNLDEIAKSTPGFSGAELANLINEAALVAARNNCLLVTAKDFEMAKDKLLMGLERKGVIMKEQEKKLTAYHEAGHAITAIHSAGSDPIHKATILPRGMALGVVMRYPLEDRFSLTRQKMLADLVVSMGGRVAEEMIFGYDFVTSGASSDIRQATALATSMVKYWGMSDKVGPVFHGVDESNPYHKEMPSEDMNRLIDSEIKALVQYGLDKAKEILTTHASQLEAIAQALLKYETLSGDEINKIIKGEDIGRSPVCQGDNIHSIGQDGVNTVKGFFE